MPDERTIEALLEEKRTLPPPKGFAAEAVANDPAIYERGNADPEGFWASEAARLKWSTPWDRVLEWELPYARWFLAGRLNVSVNCLDRHVDSGGGDKIAYHFEGEPGDRRTLTYLRVLRD